MLKVPYYTKKNCSSCDEAYSMLMMLQDYYPFQIEERDIYTNDMWLEEYGLIIPAVQIKDVFLNCEQMDIVTIEDVLKEKLDIK